MYYKTDIYFYVAECESSMHILLEFSYYEGYPGSYTEPPEPESWEPISFLLLDLENEKHGIKHIFDPPIDMTDFFSDILREDKSFDDFVSEKVFEHMEKLREEMLP